MGAIRREDDGNGEEKEIQKKKEMRYMDEGAIMVTTRKNDGKNIE